MGICRYYSFWTIPDTLNLMARVSLKFIARIIEGSCSKSVLFILVNVVHRTFNLRFSLKRFYDRFVKNFSWRFPLLRFYDFVEIKKKVKKKRKKRIKILSTSCNVYTVYKRNWRRVKTLTSRVLIKILTSCLFKRLKF